MKILVVDDEYKIRNIVSIYLHKEGFSVVETANGNEALEKIKSDSYDLVILDIMLPGIDGWTVCREIRRDSSLPVIMLTAREEEADRVLDLEIGADDYVVKPFSPRELVARVKAVLRRTGSVLETARSHGSAASECVVNEGIEINPAAREVKVLGQAVRLTVKEFDLILLMARNPGRVFPRGELLQAVWGYDYSGDTRTVDTHMNRLRDKLAAVNGSPSFISTVWGVGYKFEVI